MLSDIKAAMTHLMLKPHRMEYNFAPDKQHFLHTLMYKKFKSKDIGGILSEIQNLITVIKLSNSKLSKVK
jgi:hypothetical protein